MIRNYRVWTFKTNNAGKSEISRQNWKSAHPIENSYADGFRYYVDVSVCWMLLGVVES